jgi:NAD(P)-dependent dehydrogenase (short-subunit alcohol dehydrogenase family)
MTNQQAPVAICTGSGRKNGLGQGILLRLVKAGYRVVVSDIGHSEAHLEERDVGVSAEMAEVVANIHQAGGEAIAIACDVRKEDDVSALIEKTVAAFGRLDLMVNNAGIGYVMKDMDSISLEEWNLVLAVNLTGAWLCTKYAARQMKLQGDGGRVINIASQAAKSGFPNMTPYIASKHGLVGLTRASAIELGGSGITVNAVCPNHVTTGLGERQNEYFAEFSGLTVDEYLAAMRARIPMGRPGLVEDTANAVAFLASSEAHYITGEAMNVSGGEEMH